MLGHLGTLAPVPSYFPLRQSPLALPCDRTNGARCRRRRACQRQNSGSAGLPRQYLRTKGIKPQFPNGIVSSVSFVSTTNTARSLAGLVSLALALTPWRSPGSSEKLCPAL